MRPSSRWAASSGTRWPRSSRPDTAMNGQDTSASRVSLYRSGTPGVRHATEGDAEAFGLESFEWLDAQLATCVEAATGALAEVARGVLQLEVRLEARATSLARPEGGPVLRR